VSAKTTTTPHPSQYVCSLMSKEDLVNNFNTIIAKMTMNVLHEKEI
jgi:hypothetical protein